MILVSLHGHDKRIRRVISLEQFLIELINKKVISIESFGWKKGENMHLWSEHKFWYDLLCFRLHPGSFPLSIINFAKLCSTVWEKNWKMLFERLLWCIISETPHTPLSALSFSLHIKMHSYIWVKINVSHCAKQKKKEKKLVELRQEANYTLCSRQDGRLSWNYKLSKYNIYFTFARLSLLSDENKRKNVHETRMLQRISTFNLLTWRKILKFGAEMERKRVLVRRNFFILNASKHSSSKLNCLLILRF